eukprot:Gb_41481 [translate_table: standard]
MNCGGTSLVYIFRIHHALGDGISIMSLFLASCRRVDKPALLPTIPSGSTSKGNPANKYSPFSGLLMLWKLVLVACFTFMDVMHFIVRILWVRDSNSPISGGAGVELWPRKLSVATFTIDDMRVVKNAINGTINDVMLGIISSGFRRYLEINYREAAKRGSFEKLRFTGLAMVNTRASSGLQELANMMEGISKARWGNDMGYVLLPLSLAKFNDPLDYVRQAKVLVDRKKLSLEAIFSYKIAALVMKFLGAKAAADLDYKALASTSLLISNVQGPVEEVAFAGNPITYFDATCSSLPQAVILHMVSYAGRARMLVSVAKDIIPDPEVLTQCFEDSLQDMKKAIQRQ